MNCVVTLTFLILLFWKVAAFNNSSFTNDATWPSGMFSIPSSRKHGCPDSRNFAFETGYLLFNTVPETDSDIVDAVKRISFCTKNVVNINETFGDWPAGQYCFYRKGGTCPDNFEQSSITWQDSRNRNEAHGVLPDGNYSVYARTTMFFCCRSDGNTATSLNLPNSKQFVLLKNAESCQNINNNTCYKEENIVYRNNGDGNETTPQPASVTESGDLQIKYCYYTMLSRTLGTDPVGRCRDTYCVTIGDEEYCGLTADWEPRVSVTGGYAAMVVLTLYSVVMMLLVSCCSSPWKKIKGTFLANKKLIYQDTASARDTATSATPDNKPAAEVELTMLALDKADTSSSTTNSEDSTTTHDTASARDTASSATHSADQGATNADPGTKETSCCTTGCCSERCNGCRNACKTCCPADKKLTLAQKFMKIPLIPYSWLHLPKWAGLVVMAITLIGAPLFKVAWDVVDVGADSFYFMQLETGDLLNEHITRNTHAVNGIMVFAVLGALKSTLLGGMYLAIVGANEQEQDHAYTVLGTQVAICIKILLEDGPEMLLEYYYLDRYILDNQPWFLVAKDVVTALIYIWPIKKMLQSGAKDKEVLEAGNDKNKAFARYLYIPALVARALFSIAMATRIIGMIVQYTSGTIAPECLALTEAGLLVQTPFSTGCLNLADWVIIATVPVVLLLAGVVLVGWCIIMCVI